ncbi:hypothetical protein [Paenibacillus albus]|uniref:Uncharacterized protein n=1 Tax=Paenibacillus albus TaxID=2495582 RepID=A0A3S9ACI8_9BACL|nr:hypothetical protein [Paenibacillus albus]AZN43376.1 hypothetical protein EJC50_29550 [Paenibacillus albus]
MTRYRHGSVDQVWGSYEWLVRTKLEELDHLSRQIYKDMQLSGASKAHIEMFLHESFENLWKRVAVEEEAKLAAAGKVRGA